MSEEFIPTIVGLTVLVVLAVLAGTIYTLFHLNWKKNFYKKECAFLEMCLERVHAERTHAEQNRQTTRGFELMPALNQTQRQNLLALPSLQESHL
jgi:hypothetical protein